MSQPWTVKAWAGPYSWTVHDNDTPAGYGLAAPLTISASYPTGDLAPLVQPDAVTASFRVVVSDLHYFVLAQLGDPVTIRYWPSRTPAAGDAPSAEFAGRIASLDYEPHDLGVVFTVGCVDYTADLGELTVGTVAYPAETLDARCRRILAEAGLNVPAGVLLYGGTSTLPIAANVAARAIGPTSALELLTHTCAEWRMEFTGFPLSVGIAKVDPLTSPPLGASTFASGAAVRDDANGPYRILTTFQSPVYTAPLRVTLTGGLYALVGSPATSAPAGVVVVDAGRVDMSTRFSQRKGDAVNAITVTSDSFTPQTAKWTGPSARVEASVPTELTSAADGALLATAYLVPVSPSKTALWVAEALRWLIDAEPGSWALPFLGRGFMVTRMKGVWSPLEREWYVGLISSVTFQVDQGVPSAALGTSPWNVDPARVLNPVKWSDLPGAMTYANMSTRDTFTDYVLAGI